MATFRDTVYSLREEALESGTKYFISFTDGQGKLHDLEVSEELFVEFRQMERKTAIWSSPTSGTGSIRKFGTKR